MRRQRTRTLLSKIIKEKPFNSYIRATQATPRGGLTVCVALQVLRLPANQTSIFYTYLIQSTITTCALPVELPIRLLNGVGLEPTTSSSKNVIK